ncbi:MAG: HTTM domain-containing protein, partial [Acidobacteriales bacterium]|nr:HTTM domain-containing protein [Terriglobales bacterium]
MCLLAFLMIFLPAHRAGSVDAWRRPEIRSDFVPAWPRLLLVGFISLVYFYAGIAKLNPDWFTGGALRIWLPRAEQDPLIGPIVEHELAAHLFAYGGLAFDLFIVPLLLWRRTRIFGYLWASAFHFLNYRIFDIGVFPWLMVLATTIYFSPDWPRRWLKWRRKTEPRIFEYSSAPICLGAAFLILQALFPLRHWLYPGPVNWTEEGHRFSWHMMLRSKSGTATFVITDPVTKETWEIDSRQYLTGQQARKVATRPDMLLQFAHYLAKAEAASHNRTDPLEVRVISSISLDERPPQPLVYPEINLTKVRRHLGHNDWIMPLLSREEAAKLTPPEAPMTRSNP